MSKKKSKPKKSNIKWWQDRVNVLKGRSEEAKEYCPEITETAEIYDDKEGVGAWSFLKLLVLGYYVSVYTSIAKERFGRIAYIDLCAGDGFNRIKGINEVIAGSPVLAHIIPRKRTKEGKSKEFDQIILIEKNKNKSEKLKQVMPKTAHILNADANSDEAIEFIKEKLMEKDIQHFIAFIDPYGFEINWRTIKELLLLKGDLIINFMTTSIQRPWGSFHSDKKDLIMRPKKESFDLFFGDESWLDIPSPENGGTVYDLLDLYISKINKYREKVIPIQVKGLQGQYTYHLLVATRKTSGTQGWLEAVYRVRDKVESVTDKDVKTVFDIYNGRQPTLDFFNSFKA